MGAIWQREFLNLFRGFRVIVLVTVLTLCSVALASWYEFYAPPFLKESPLTTVPNSIYIQALHFLTVTFGFIIIVSLSYQTVNNEVQSGRIRLYITKVSRTQVMIGKFLGIWLFWVLTLTLCYLILAGYYHTFYASYLLQMYSIVTFAVGVTLLLSTLFRRQIYAILVGISLGILFPIAEMSSHYSSMITTSPFLLLAPAYWLGQPNPFLQAVPAVIGLLCLGGAILIMRRKDL